MNRTDITTPSRSVIASQFSNTVHRFKNLLARKGWVLLLCVSLGAGIALGLEWNAPAKYRSTASMVVGTRTPFNIVAEDPSYYFGTQIELMQSAVVSNQALAAVRQTHPEIAPCPVKLKVNVTPKTSIFNLRMTGANAQFVPVFLQAVMEQYIEVKKGLVKNQVGSGKESVEKELENARAQVQAGKKAQLDYESKNNVVFLETVGNQAADYLVRLTRQQAELQSELQLLRRLSVDDDLQALSLNKASGLLDHATPDLRDIQSNSGQAGLAADNAAPTVNSPALSSELVASQSEYFKTKQQISLLKARQDEWSQFLRPQHPKMVELKEEIDRKNRLLDIYRSQSQQLLQNLVHSLELEVHGLEQQKGQWETNSLEISRKMSEYQSIKTDTARLESTVDRLSSILYTLNADRNTAQDNVALYEPATLPQRLPNPLFWLLPLTSVLGLILGLGILIVLDHLDDRPTCLSELKAIASDPILGQIPLVRTKDKTPPGVLANEDPRHGLVEACRNLRSSISALGSSGKRPKTLAVTSAIPDEGKSMTAANLAITLAWTGARVLLIDADLRHGLLHERLNTSSSPGLSDVLRGQTPWRQALVPTGTPNLTLLPCGSPHRHPGELLAAPAKEALLNEIIPQFDYVIFDTVPVMAADDISNLASSVDGVLVVVRAGYTSGRVARAAMDLLRQRKANILGIVFNAVGTYSSDYYYYRYTEYFPKLT